MNNNGKKKITFACDEHSLPLTADISSVATGEQIITLLSKKDCLKKGDKMIPFLTDLRNGQEYALTVESNKKSLGHKQTLEEVGTKEVDTIFISRTNSGA